MTIKILGLMTGSSADGLDVCLVAFTGDGPNPAFEVLFSGEVDYPKQFKTAFRNPLSLTEDEINHYNQDLGKWLASEIEKLNLNFDAIASHGQTIKHEPPRFTLQIGDPSFMAKTFDVQVVFDFRSADVALGGQGAPLIPIVDRYLFQKNDADILALNIGGIANLTIVPKANSNKPLLAWDTGPGNTLIDKAVRLYSQGKLAYDPDGSIAAQGVVNDKLLSYLLKHEFYELPPPRSAGQEQFGDQYFSGILEHYAPETDQEFKDLILTLTVLTALTITNSVQSLMKLYTPQTLHIGGGGAYNKTLLNLLMAALPFLEIAEVDLKGVNQSNKEAFGFAYLGYLHLKGLPGNIPSVTGAEQETILGELCNPDK